MVLKDSRDIEDPPAALLGFDRKSCSAACQATSHVSIVLMWYYDHDTTLLDTCHNCRLYCSVHTLIYLILHEHTYKQTTKTKASSE